MSSNAVRGPVCKKHPDLGGLRLASSSRPYGACVACNQASQAAYYEANKERIREEHRSYARQNRQKNSARAVAWAKENKERHALNAARWRAENPERARAFTSTWAKNNLDSCAEYEARKRLTIKLATPAWANQFFIREAYRLAKLREKVCGGKWHVDHIVPIKSPLVCGLHVEDNLQVIPGGENCAKGNRYWPDMPGASK